MRASGRSDLSSAFGGAIKGRIADLLGSHGGRFDGLGSSFAKLFRRKALNHCSGQSAIRVPARCPSNRYDKQPLHNQHYRAVAPSFHGHGANRNVILIPN
jgi:hypothetical protein